MPEQKVKKAVIIMYPDSRTTGGLLCAEMGEPISFLRQQFRHIVTPLIERYKRQGLTVNGIVFADTTPKTYSLNYPVAGFDRLIPVNVSLRDWKREQHADYLKEAMQGLACVPETQFLVGGFHAHDCVLTMTNVLRELGFQADINFLLTNRLYDYLYLHYGRKYTGFYSPEDRKEDRQMDRLNLLARNEDISRQLI